MRIAFLTTGQAGQALTPEERLELSILHRELPLELAARGHQVGSFFLSPTSARLRRERVPYVFVREANAMRGAQRLCAHLLRREPTEFENIRNTLDEVEAFEPDVLHVHGTGLHLHLRAARRRLGGTPFFIHHHGESPARNPIGRRMQRENFEKQTLLFGSEERAKPFLASGIISDSAQINIVVEISSAFRSYDTLLARAETGLTGHPLCLSVAPLLPANDPQTLVEGFARIHRERPRAQLYLCYSSDELRSELESIVDSHPGLSDAVHWLGHLPHEELEWIYNSADFVLQCSKPDGTYPAVLEAIACGAIPVLSDIPVFRQIIGNTTVSDSGIGSLFSIGDAQGLATAILSIDPASYEERSFGVRRRFESEFSFAALAAKLERLYQGRLSRQSSGTDL